MRLVAYLRVSSVGQAQDGFGLDVQRTAIRGWAKNNDHTIVRWVEDAAISGTTDALDRPAFAEALALIDEGEADGLIAYDMTRLARELMVQEVALGLLWSAGAQVFTVATGLVPADDDSDPMRTLVRQLLGALAQFERASIVSRMKRGKAEAAKRGRHTDGRYAFGSHPDHPEEATTLARIHHWRRQDRSFRWIAEALNQEGRPSRTGKPWSHSTVRNILTRPN